MGRVTRMPGTGLPKGERRKRRKGEGGRSNKQRKGREFNIKVWSSLLLLLATVSLGVMLWFGFRRGSGVAPAQPASLPVTQVEKRPAKPPGFPSPTEDEVVAIVRESLEMREPVEVASHFRMSTTSPADAAEFLKSLETRDGPVGQLEWLGTMDANGLQIEGVLVHFKTSDNKPRNRIALLTPDAGGVWKPDFDAFARTATPSWPDFLEKRSEMIQARVYAARDSYFNGPFSDESQWLCFGLASPDTEEVLYGYCKADSPQARAMMRILSNQISLNRATLEIRSFPDALPRQFLISRVVAEDWVTSEKPFDEGFE